MWADAVFEGGGVKGIGLVGALKVAEAQGYQWRSVAGTSAGSIIAALVAAGYGSDELAKVIMATNFSDLLVSSLTNRLPYVGPVLKIWFKKGLYSSVGLETWIQGLLAAKGVETFADLDESVNLQIIASDISSGNLAVFPRDLANYNIKPGEMSIARAVRMSCSIPFFFEPVPLYDPKQKTVFYMVDGGLLSNFPIWIFDKELPRWPTFGFRLQPNKRQFHDINGPFSMLSSIAWTMVEAHDNHYIRSNDKLRTIHVPSLDVGLTDFDLSKEKQEELFQAGVTSGEEFFGKFNFKTYLAIRKGKS